MRLLRPIIFLLLFSCKADKSIEKWEHYAIKANCEDIRKRPFVESANVQRDIPESFINPDGGDMRCIEELLGIHTLRNGYDSLEIRVWGTDSAFSFNDRLIRIQNTKGAYNAELYKLNIRQKEVRDSANPNLVSYPPDSLIVSKRNLGTPRSGWQSFMQRLKEMGIYDLPDFKKVTGYYGEDTDGGWQWVEYAWKNKYRQYNYPVAGKYGKPVKERQQFEKMVRYIEEEFAIL